MKSRLLQCNASTFCVRRMIRYREILKIGNQRENSQQMWVELMTKIIHGNIFVVLVRRVARASPTCSVSKTSTRRKNLKQQSDGNKQGQSNGFCTTQFAISASKFRPNYKARFIQWKVNHRKNCTRERPFGIHQVEHSARQINRNAADVTFPSMERTSRALLLGYNLTASQSTGIPSHSFA